MALPQKKRRRLAPLAYRIDLADSALPAALPMPAAAVVVPAVAAMSLAMMAAMAMVPLAVMMVASRPSGKLKRAGQISLYRLICAAGYAAF